MPSPARRERSGSLTPHRLPGSIAPVRPSRAMRKLLLITFLLAATACVAAIVVFRPGKAARVATGLVSHTLCSETFVTGLDPARTFAETLQSMPGIRRLIPVLRYQYQSRRQRLRPAAGARRHARRFLLRLRDAGPAHRHRPGRTARGRAPGPLAGLGSPSTSEVSSASSPTRMPRSMALPTSQGPRASRAVDRW
jgi:hypothetical protein